MEADDFLFSRNARPQKGGIGSHQTILLARRTRTMKRCSSDARSGRSISPHPLRTYRTSLEGPLGVVRSVLKKMECRFGVILGIEGDSDTGLRQREAKQFAFARAVLD